jgi:hypothetical protein
MAYEKLEQHRILPRALYDSYTSGYTDGSHINGHKLTANEYPALLTEEFQFYSQSPHQLAEWMLKKWYEEGFNYAQRDNEQSIALTSLKSEG